MILGNKEKSDLSCKVHILANPMTKSFLICIPLIMLKFIGLENLFRKVNQLYSVIYKERHNEKLSKERSLEGKEVWLSKKYSAHAVLEKRK